MPNKYSNDDWSFGGLKELFSRTKEVFDDTLPLIKHDLRDTGWIVKDFFDRLNPKNYYEPLIHTPSDWFRDLNPKNQWRPSGRYIPDYPEHFSKWANRPWNTSPKMLRKWHDMMSERGKVNIE